MDELITMAHGAGGKVSHEIVEHITGILGDVNAVNFDDSAVINPEGKRVAFTTDSYVITPIEFPGGNIGRIAVCGTVNDLTTSGAVPKYLSLALIVEEGLSFETFDRIIKSIHDTAEEAGVKIVTGDTKVVFKGSADKIFINTSGIGYINEDVNISGANAKPGDAVIITGSIGDHGMTIMSQREGLKFEGDLMSDCAPLNKMIHAVMDECDVHVLRDPTRGGLATTLNELAAQSNVQITINEADIIVKPSVQTMCAALGLEPYYVANEGKMIIILDNKDAEKAVSILRTFEYGKDASIIGHVDDDSSSKVVLKTIYGTYRLLPVMSGDLLPRIC